MDIGGRRLRLIGAGAGAPSVILEAGAGGFSAVWRPVMEGVARFTRVYAYDRAGYGMSDAALPPRTSSRAVADLHTLLAAAAIHPPYVLVGHSLGGFHCRLYTSRFPDDVAGLVLVDADVEEEWTAVLPDDHRSSLDTMTSVLRIAGSLARIGLPQMLVRLRAPEHVRDLPASVRREVVRYGFTRTALRTMRAEYEGLAASATELRGSPRDLGDRPLVVIRRGKPGVRIPGVSRERAAEIEEALAQMQARMAMWSRRGRVVVAANSGHDVHIDEPDVVVEAIRSVVLTIRAESGLDSRGERMS